MPFDPSPLLFWLKKFAAVMALPPLAPMLLIGLGLLLLKRHRRTGLSLAWGGLLCAFVLSAPFTVGLMLRGLEDVPPLTLQEARRADAIVILGGGKRTHAPEFGSETGGETVNRLTLERLRYGARLARDTGLPILVTGGLAHDGWSEAELMRSALERDFGIPPRWVEHASRDTRQNAEFAAVHLQAAKVRRIVLVTHAVHMARAQAEFERHGLDVVPAPTGWLSGPPDPNEWPDLVPNANAAYAGWLAAHEWLGGLAYRLSR